MAARCAVGPAVVVLLMIERTVPAGLVLAGAVLPAFPGLGGLPGVPAPTCASPDPPADRATSRLSAHTRSAEL